MSVAKERRTVVQGGRLWMAVQYTAIHDHDPNRRREAKCMISTPARETLNARLSWQKLMIILAANFGSQDIVVTLTYDPRVRPMTRDEADKRLSNFIRLLRKRRRCNDTELIYVRVTEGYHSQGVLHHHLIINATGADFRLVRELWAKWGDNIDFEPFGKDGPERWARYLTKEPRNQGRKYVGDRTWRTSRNVIRPVSKSIFVPASESLQPPPGAEVVERDECVNCYGRFTHILATIPDGQKATTEYPEI